MSDRLALFALAIAMSGVASARPAVQTQRFALGGWSLDVAVDHFTGARRCLLRGTAGTMAYQPGAIGFRVRSRDTPSAIYRVNDGPVIRWQDRYPGLLAANVVVEGPGLDDPTGRIVWIPESDLVGASTVRVRVGHQGYGALYHVGPVTRMIAAARGLGCQIVSSL